MNNYIVLDTETTNGFDFPLVYDCGWSVVTENGKTLKTRSYVNMDIFLQEQLLMSVAYFSEKIPQYIDDILNKKRFLAHWNTIRKRLYEDCVKYNVVAIVAHNARFDYRACQTTQRFLTKSKFRWFFPYGVEIWDTLKMSQQVFTKDNDYLDFCKTNDFMVNKKRPRLTAEIIYRYLTQDLTFEEKHTGLEDTEIEKQIFWECLKRNPNVECNCWS